MTSLFDLAQEILDFDPQKVDTYSKNLHKEGCYLGGTVSNVQYDEKTSAIANETLELLSQCSSVFMSRNQLTYEAPQGSMQSKSCENNNKDAGSSIPLKNIPQQNSYKVLPVSNNIGRHSLKSYAKATDGTLNASESLLLTPNSNTQSACPDTAARQILKEMHDEIDRIPQSSFTSPAQGDDLVKYLKHQYLDMRLNKLRSTPFVDLARRKTIMRLEKLTNDMLNKYESINANCRPNLQKSASTMSLMKEKDYQRGETKIQVALENAQAKFLALSEKQKVELSKAIELPESKLQNLSPPMQELVRYVKRFTVIQTASSHVKE